MSPAAKLTATALRKLAVMKLGLAEIACFKARQALEAGNIELADIEIHHAAMRGEEAAKIVDELKGL